MLLDKLLLFDLLNQPDPLQIVGQELLRNLPIYMVPLELLALLLLALDHDMLQHQELDH